MDTGQFWQLIHDARGQVADPTDPEAVAAGAGGPLAGQSPERIVAAQQVLWDLMAASYRAPLWAAAHLINGGCSGDGFDYVRGWLITQGREVLGRAVRPCGVRRHRPGPGVRGDLAIVWDAHLTATGEELPGDVFTISYPDLDPAWRFGFGDPAEMARRLPALSAL
ncbi:DUF4240 domain-containing protein [Streptomyces sp. MI02-7b]|uniref:DUF4240 domain-containing protein n=1 Tax=Streptomyces sp. MI02-7b TaxID=462941 RepID=UPI0029A462FF|nr:DUF4240 domain-containing protein [Streptomyces sp. MI02-7b]MDX3073330.1 DUF4240 domain-containing protein [Streptomyces sp. MI02-7b]